MCKPYKTFSGRWCYEDTGVGCLSCPLYYEEQGEKIISSSYNERQEKEVVDGKRE